MTLPVLQSTLRAHVGDGQRNVKTLARRRETVLTASHWPKTPLKGASASDLGRRRGGRAPAAGRAAIGLWTSHTTAADLAALSCPYFFGKRIMGLVSQSNCNSFMMDVARR